MRDNGLLKNVTTTLLNKTDGKEHKNRQDYWRRTFKTYSPFELIVEASV